jgi:2'-5' RNA ligase
MSEIPPMFFSVGPGTWWSGKAGFIKRITPEEEQKGTLSKTVTRVAWLLKAYVAPTLVDRFGFSEKDVNGFMESIGIDAYNNSGTGTRMVTNICKNKDRYLVVNKAYTQHATDDEVADSLIHEVEHMLQMGVADMMDNKQLETGANVATIRRMLDRGQSVNEIVKYFDSQGFLEYNKGEGISLDNFRNLVESVRDDIAPWSVVGKSLKEKFRARVGGDPISAEIQERWAKRRREQPGSGGTKMDWDGIYLGVDEQDPDKHHYWFDAVGIQGIYRFFRARVLPEAEAKLNMRHEQEHGIEGEYKTVYKKLGPDMWADASEAYWMTQDEILEDPDISEAIKTKVRAQGNVRIDMPAPGPLEGEGPAKRKKAGPDKQAQKLDPTMRIWTVDPHSHRSRHLVPLLTYSYVDPYSKKGIWLRYMGWTWDPDPRDESGGGAVLLVQKFDEATGEFGPTEEMDPAYAPHIIEVHHAIPSSGEGPLEEAGARFGWVKRAKSAMRTDALSDPTTGKTVVPGKLYSITGDREWVFRFLGWFEAVENDADPDIEDPIVLRFDVSMPGRQGKMSTMDFGFGVIGELEEIGAGGEEAGGPLEAGATGLVKQAIENSPFMPEPFKHERSGKVLRPGWLYRDERDESVWEYVGWKKLYTHMWEGPMLLLHQRYERPIQDWEPTVRWMVPETAVHLTEIGRGEGDVEGPLEASLGSKWLSRKGKTAGNGVTVRPNWGNNRPSLPHLENKTADTKVLHLRQLDREAIDEIGGIAEQIRGAVLQCERSRAECSRMSHALATALERAGFSAVVAAGWFMCDKPDNDLNPTGANFEHTWVEVMDPGPDRRHVIVDVTADQFNEYLRKPAPPIFIVPVGKLKRYKADARWRPGVIDPDSAKIGKENPMVEMENKLILDEIQEQVEDDLKKAATVMVRDRWLSRRGQDEGQFDPHNPEHLKALIAKMAKHPSQAGKPRELGIHIKGIDWEPEGMVGITEMDPVEGQNAIRIKVSCFKRIYADTSRTVPLTQNVMTDILDEADKRSLMTDVEGNQIFGVYREKPYDDNQYFWGWIEGFVEYQFAVEVPAGGVDEVAASITDTIVNSPEVKGFQTKAFQLHDLFTSSESADRLLYEEAPSPLEGEASARDRWMARRAKGPGAKVWDKFDPANDEHVKFLRHHMVSEYDVSGHATDDPMDLGIVLLGEAVEQGGEVVITQIGKSNDPHYLYIRVELVLRYDAPPNTSAAEMIRQEIILQGLDKDLNGRTIVNQFEYVGWNDDVDHIIIRGYKRIRSSVFIPESGLVQVAQSIYDQVLGWTDVHDFREKANKIYSLCAEIYDMPKDVKFEPFAEDSPLEKGAAKKKDRGSNPLDPNPFRPGQRYFWHTIETLKSEVIPGDAETPEMVDAEMRTYNEVNARGIFDAQYTLEAIAQRAKAYFIVPGPTKVMDSPPSYRWIGKPDPSVAYLYVQGMTKADVEYLDGLIAGRIGQEKMRPLERGGSFKAQWRQRRAGGGYGISVARDVYNDAKADDSWVRLSKMMGLVMTAIDDYIVPFVSGRFGVSEDKAEKIVRDVHFEIKMFPPQSTAAASYYPRRDLVEINLWYLDCVLDKGDIKGLAATLSHEIAHAYQVRHYRMTREDREKFRDTEWEDRPHEQAAEIAAIQQMLSRGMTDDEILKTISKNRPEMYRWLIDIAKESDPQSLVASVKARWRARRGGREHWPKPFYPLWPQEWGRFHLGGIYILSKDLERAYTDHYDRSGRRKEALPNPIPAGSAIEVESITPHGYSTIYILDQDRRTLGYMATVYSDQLDAAIIPQEADPGKGPLEGSLKAKWTQRRANTDEPAAFVFGDVDPFTYGGILVWNDGSAAHIEPMPDEDEHKDELTIHRFDIEMSRSVFDELDWITDEHKEAMARGVDVDISEMKAMAKGSLMDRAGIYNMVGTYFGWEEIDSYPLVLTKAEAEARYRLPGGPEYDQWRSEGEQKYPLEGSVKARWTQRRATTARFGVSGEGMLWERFPPFCVIQAKEPIMGRVSGPDSPQIQVLDKGEYATVQGHGTVLGAEEFSVVVWPKKRKIGDQTYFACYVNEDEMLAKAEKVCEADKECNIPLEGEGPIEKQAAEDDEEPFRFAPKFNWGTMLRARHPVTATTTLGEHQSRAHWVHIRPGETFQLIGWANSYGFTYFYLSQIDEPQRVGWMTVGEIENHFEIVGIGWRDEDQPLEASVRGRWMAKRALAQRIYNPVVGERWKEGSWWMSGPTFQIVEHVPAYGDQPGKWKILWDHNGHEEVKDRDEINRLGMPAGKVSEDVAKQTDIRPGMLFKFVRRPRWHTVDSIGGSYGSFNLALSNIKLPVVSEVTRIIPAGEFLQHAQPGSGSTSCEDRIMFRITNSPIPGGDEEYIMRRTNFVAYAIFVSTGGGEDDEGPLEQTASLRGRPMPGSVHKVVDFIDVAQIVGKKPSIGDKVLVEKVIGPMSLSSFKGQPIPASMEEQVLFTAVDGSFSAITLLPHWWNNTIMLGDKPKAESSILGRWMRRWAMRKEADHKHEFSSTQINLPPEIAQAIIAVGQQIQDEDIYEDPEDPSFGREQNPHTTVKFGLHTGDPAEVQKILEGEPPVKLRLGKVGMFPAKDDVEYDVVWVEVISDDLHRLNAKISDQAEVTDTHPEYHPHATVAYVKKGLGKKYVEGPWAAQLESALAGVEADVPTIMFSGKDGTEQDIALGSVKSRWMSRSGVHFSGTPDEDPSEPEHADWPFNVGDVIGFILSWNRRSEDDRFIATMTHRDAPYDGGGLELKSIDAGIDCPEGMCCVTAVAHAVISNPDTDWEEAHDMAQAVVSGESLGPGSEWDADESGWYVSREFTIEVEIADLIADADGNGAEEAIANRICNHLTEGEDFKNFTEGVETIMQGIANIPPYPEQLSWEPEDVEGPLEDEPKKKPKKRKKKASFVDRWAKRKDFDPNRPWGLRNVPTKGAYVVQRISFDPHNPGSGIAQILIHGYPPPPSFPSWYFNFRVDDEGVTFVSDSRLPGEIQLKIFSDLEAIISTKHEVVNEPLEGSTRERWMSRRAKADGPMSQLRPLKNLWYENEQGDRWYPTDEELKDAYHMQDVMNNGFPYQHLLSPILQDSCCTSEGQLFRGETTINSIGPIVMALIKDYGWGFTDAITVAGHTCERCLNILLEEATGQEYPQKDKDSAGTHCDICQFLDPEYHQKMLGTSRAPVHRTRGEMTSDLARAKARILASFQKHGSEIRRLVKQAGTGLQIGLGAGEASARGPIRHPGSTDMAGNEPGRVSAAWRERKKRGLAPTAQSGETSTTRSADPAMGWSAPTVDGDLLVKEAVGSGWDYRRTIDSVVDAWRKGVPEANKRVRKGWVAWAVGIGRKIGQFRRRPHPEGEQYHWIVYGRPNSYVMQVEPNDDGYFLGPEVFSIANYILQDTAPGWYLTTLKGRLFLMAPRSGEIGHAETLRQRFMDQSFLVPNNGTFRVINGIPETENMKPYRTDIQERRDRALEYRREIDLLSFQVRTILEEVSVGGGTPQQRDKVLEFGKSYGDPNFRERVTDPAEVAKFFLEYAPHRFPDWFAKGLGIDISPVVQEALEKGIETGEEDEALEASLMEHWIRRGKHNNMYISDYLEETVFKGGGADGEDIIIPRFAVWGYNPARNRGEVLAVSDNVEDLQREYGPSLSVMFVATKGGVVGDVVQSPLEGPGSGGDVEASIRGRWMARSGKRTPVDRRRFTAFVTRWFQRPKPNQPAAEFPSVLWDQWKSELNPTDSKSGTLHEIRQWMLKYGGYHPDFMRIKGNLIIGSSEIQAQFDEFWPDYWNTTEKLYEYYQIVIRTDSDAEAKEAKDLLDAFITDPKMTTSPGEGPLEGEASIRDRWTRRRAQDDEPWLPGISWEDYPAGARSTIPEMESSKAWREQEREKQHLRNVAEQWGLGPIQVKTHEEMAAKCREIARKVRENWENNPQTFLYSITYEVVTPESAEQGDFSESGFDVKDEEATLLEIVSVAKNRGISGHRGGVESEWWSSEPEQNYSDGEETSYSLHIKTEDEHVRSDLNVLLGGWPTVPPGELLPPDVRYDPVVEEPLEQEGKVRDLWMDRRGKKGMSYAQWLRKNEKDIWTATAEALWTTLHEWEIGAVSRIPTAIWNEMVDVGINDLTLSFSNDYQPEESSESNMVYFVDMASTWFSEDCAFWMVEAFIDHDYVPPTGLVEVARKSSNWGDENEDRIRSIGKPGFPVQEPLEGEVRDRWMARRGISHEPYWPDIEMPDAFYTAMDLHDYEQAKENGLDGPITIYKDLDLAKEAAAGLAGIFPGAGGPVVARLYNLTKSDIRPDNAAVRRGARVLDKEIFYRIWKLKYMPRWSDTIRAVGTAKYFGNLSPADVEMVWGSKIEEAAAA